jgi:serine/threonine-protein kinase HipA
VTTCLVCLDGAAPEPPADPYHAGCLQQLLGIPHLPRVAFDREAIPARVAGAVGKFSISGVQPKAQVELAPDRAALELVAQGGGYLLKPDVMAYRCLPANEHITMVLARRCGIGVPPNGLLRLADGSLAYLVRRFDRTGEGQKRVQEDLCSLAGLRSGDKYEGSAERCFGLVLQHAADPAPSARRLFLQLCFSDWVGNGDLHLKNLSLVERDDGLYTLSPAYDLLSTHLYGDRELALPVRGKKRNITRRNWIELAERSANIPRAEARQILDEMLDHRALAVEIIARSSLDPDLRQHYASRLTERAEALSP